MQLIKNNLILVSVHRSSLIDADYVGVCDNCGKPIVNIATVKDVDTNKIYDIGLDCKKKLIDKKFLDKLKLETNEWEFKHKSKSFKRESTDALKFLTLTANPENEIVFDRGDNEIRIYDNKPLKGFESIATGNIVFMESYSYCMKIGLSKFIEDLYKQNKIKSCK
jgi:hypothetical protein